MTKKEFNTIKAAAYQACLAIPDIAEVLKVSDTAYIWEVWQGQKHAYIVTSCKTQMNDNTLKENGFDIEQAKVRELYSVNRKTKTVNL